LHAREFARASTGNFSQVRVVNCIGLDHQVRVDPARAAEAREVIDEGERLQPPPEPTAIAPRSRFRSPLFFLAGLLAGGVLVFLALKPVATLSSADSNTTATASR